MSPRGNATIYMRTYPSHARHIQERDSEPAKWQHPSEGTVGIKPGSNLPLGRPNVHFGVTAFPDQVREPLFDVGPSMCGVEEFDAPQRIQTSEEADSSLTDAASSVEG
jgi:hypothetical protein